MFYYFKQVVLNLILIIDSLYMYIAYLLKIDSDWQCQLLWLFDSWHWPVGHDGWGERKPFGVAAVPDVRYGVTCRPEMTSYF